MDTFELLDKLTVGFCETVLMIFCETAFNDILSFIRAILTFCRLDANAH